MEISQYLDATYLKTPEQAEISEDETLQRIISLTKEAIKYNYKLIMVRANYILNVKEILKVSNSSVLIGTVISFPDGTNAISEKLKEAEKAIKLGAHELDFVLNYKAFKNRDFSLINNEIISCTKLALDNQKVVKWIIETAALTTQEIIVISQRIKTLIISTFGNENTESVYVKSSTGFFKTANNLPHGATLKNMRLIVENAKPLKVKAAGGVRDFETALKMIEIGVDRIGTSSAKDIVTNKENLPKNNTY